MSISAAVRRFVRERAAFACEYCGLKQVDIPILIFHLDHIVPRKHSGSDDAANLCLACHWCNFHKGSNIAGLEDGILVPLFNPRLDRWTEHFRYLDHRIEGITLMGRVTVRVLNMNQEDGQERRRNQS